MLVESVQSERYGDDLQERARRFLEEHGYDYQGEFPETGEGEQEKKHFFRDEGRPDERCWLKTSYPEKEDGTPGIRITFNRHDGSGNPHITTTIWADGEDYSALTDEEKSDLKQRIKKQRDATRKRAEKEKAIADELADQSCNRFSEAINSPLKEEETYFSKKGSGQPLDIHNLRWEKHIEYDEQGNKKETWVALAALRDIKGNIRALQELWPDKTQSRPRNKNNVGKVGGCFNVHGGLEDGEDILICEGVATAISLFRATKKTTLAVTSCGNIEKVVELVSKHNKRSKIIICADNDHHREGDGKGNPGLDAARKVAVKFGCELVSPSFQKEDLFNSEGDPRTDFDDLRQLHGMEEVKAQVEASTTLDEEEAEEGELPDYIKDFNEKYALVHQSKSLILVKKYNPTMERNTIELESVSSFHTWNLPIKTEDGKSASKAWLAHPKRRQYFGGLVFDPRHEGHFNDCYNLFQGFPIVPKKGDCSMFNELVYLLSGENDEIASYIRKWLAHMIQRPGELPEVAIAFRGLQGTGKGRFFSYVRQLVSPHSFELANMDKIVGNFNVHLKDLLLVHVNEALWGGNKADVGLIKALITDQTNVVEPKGVDSYEVRNCKRLIFSSNEDWIVPMDIDDRRFVVADVSSRHKEDESFFKPLQRQMEEGGGIAALMYELVNEDLSGWHPRKKPRNKGVFDLKVRGMKAAHRWLYDCLKRGWYTLEIGEEYERGWESTPRYMSKDRLYRDFTYYSENTLRARHLESESIFWKGIKEIFPNMSARREGGGKRQREIELPTLQQARALFEAFAKENPEELWED